MDKTPEKIPELIGLEKVKLNNLKFAKKFENNKINQIDKLAKLLHKSRASTTARIEKLLSNPEQNAEALQKEVYNMMMLNGVLKEILVYKSNMLTYDHFLVCSNVGSKTKKAFENMYKKAANRLEQYNIKFNCRWWIQTVIKKGEIYLYKKIGKDHITYVEIPSEFCRVVSAVGCVQKYAINLSKISNEVLDYFPDEIKSIYRKYKSGKIPQDKLDNGYYKIESNNAVAFSIDFLNSKNPPYYSSVLRDLSMLNDMQVAKREAEGIDNYKLIQMLIPSDDEGNILADADEAQLYLDALKSVLPVGVGAVGMPYTIEPVTLGDSQGKTLEYIHDLKNEVYDNTGINDDLFSGSKSNNQAIIYGANVDSLLALNLLEQIKIYLNQDFKTVDELKNFKIIFVDSTIMNKDEKIRNAVSNSATWNSRLQMFAYMGLEPKELFDVLNTEDLIDIDDRLRPLMTSHTAKSSDNGRPKASDDTPNTVGDAQN